MPRDQNIFYNVVRDENSLSELLSNLLQFESFRSVFGGLLAEKLGFSIDFDYDDIRTQFAIGLAGIPDIAIENDDCLLLIESKIGNDTPLTRNQPRSYLEYLAADNQERIKALVLLAPADYSQEYIVRADVGRFLREAHRSRIKFSVLHWEDVHHALRRSGLAEISPIFEHFAALLTSWFSTDMVTFDRTELPMLYSKEVPALYLKTTQFVDQIRKKLSKSYKVTREINEYGHGVYVKTGKGTPILWFGVWYQYWQKSGHPFCLAVLEEWSPTVAKRFRAKCGKEMFPFEREDWSIHGLSQELIEGPDPVKKVVAKISEVVDYIVK